MINFIFHLLVWLCLPILGSFSVYLLILSVVFYTYLYTVFFTDTDLIWLAFFTFPLFDIIQTVLLSTGLDISIVSFQGFTLYALFFGCFHKGLFIQTKFLLLSLLMLVPILYGLLKGNSPIAVIAFIKSFYVFSIMLYLIITNNKFKFAFNKLSVILLVYIACLFQIYIEINGIHNYLLAMNIDLFFSSRGIGELGEIPIGFFTINSLTGEKEARFLGFFFSPDKFSYLVLYLLSLLLLDHRKLILNNYFGILFKVSFFSFILFLLHVKAVVLLMIVFFVAVYSFRYKFLRPFMVRFLFFIFGGAFFVIFIVQFLPKDILSSSGAIQHLWGLVGPFSQINNITELFIGNGIGSGGTIGGATRGDGLSKSDVGGESFIGSLFYQAGILGLFSYYYLFSFIDQIAKKRLEYKSYIIVSSGLIAMFVSCLLSEAIVSLYQSAAIALSFTCYLNYKHKKIFNRRIL